jgi:hypothetical protein
MCNINYDTQQLIEEVIRDWTLQGRAFTTYEASKEVQARLREHQLPFVRHQDMRAFYENDSEELREALSSRNYTRTLQVMGSENGQSLQANVYHPAGYDVSQYQPLARKGSVGSMSPQVPSSNLVGTPPANSISYGVTPTSVATPSVPKDPDVAEVNKSGELWVGIKYVEDAGLHPGDAVDITVHNGTVIMAPLLSATLSPVTKRTVERLGNLRLSPRDRRMLGLSGNRFKITATPGEIKVTVA